jgi:hypothetical protein
MNSVVQRINALDPALFQTIESQTTDDERRSLLAVQRATAARHESYVYLEIGSHLGGSIQTHLLDPRCTRIFSIDPRPRQQPDDREEGFVYTYEDNSTARMLELLRSVDAAQVAKITCFETDAAEVDPRAVQPAPHLIFIDGEHTNRAVLSDFAACSRFMAEGATVLFHDYGFVAPAVDQICATLCSARSAHVAMRLDGSLFAVFMDPVMVRTDAHLASLYQRHVSAERARKLRAFAKTLTPAPLWRLLRYLRRLARG